MYPLPGLHILQDLNVHIGEYIIYGGGVLAIHGIRPTDDLDILVLTSMLPQILNKESYTLRTTSDKQTIYQIDIVEIANSCPGFSDEQLIDIIKNPQIIQGRPFMTLEDTIQFKKSLSRPKDRKDIFLIEEALTKLDMPN